MRWPLAGLLLGLLSAACAPGTPRAEAPLPPAAASAEPRTALPAPAPAAPPGETHPIRVAGGLLHVRFEPTRFELGGAELLSWVERAARAVAGYYGDFPVSRVELTIHAAPGRGVHGGHTLPSSPPRITIRVGRRASRQALDRNWSLTHEMVHLAFPDLPRPQLWLEEGLASYVEPIARARMGWIDEADVWREWLENLALGLPRAGDRGLDHTPTWGRTYWGGALYCFLADLEIRRRTEQRHELRDALRAILAAGGNITQRWNIERALHIGDAATGTRVLTELYEKMKDEPVEVDLAQLWRELGVRLEHDEVRYDDGAPWAELRRHFVLGR